MKKIVLLLLALLLLIPAVVMTSCGDEECEHEWKAATCTAAKTCTKCQATEGTAAEHTYGEWQVTKQPTCVAQGERAKACTACNATVTEAIPATGVHTYGAAVETKAPTCVDDGVSTKTCTSCGDAVTTAIPATGIHTPGVWQTTKQVTCGEAGEQKQYCSVCETLLKTNTIPATGKHKDSDGDGVCNVCNAVTVECEHEWTGATCTTPATCTKCGSTGEVDPNAHNEEAIPAVEATCTTPGSKNGKKCSICGTVTVEPTVVPVNANNHAYGEYITDEAGHHRVCGECQYEEMHIPHVDSDRNGLCDTCGFGQEIPETVYYEITFKALAYGSFTDVMEGFFDKVVVKAEAGKALSEEALKAIAAVRYQGRGFAAWYYDEAFENAFDPTAVITGNIVLYGDYGDLAGENVTWSYEESTQTLKLEGEGDMFDFTSIYFVPWSGLDIKNVEFDGDITSIGAYTFYVETISDTGMNLGSISIPEGITKIGDYAFYGESTLTEVKFPESLVTIGQHAFRACKGLTYIDIGGKNLEKVNESAFAECEGAKYVVFNDAIEDSAQVFDLCKFTHAYFAGNKGQFESVTIGFGNLQLELAYMFFYTDYEPQKAGAYWHRDEAGAPKQWCYSIYYLPSNGIKTAIAKDYVFVKDPKITEDNIAFRDAIRYEGYQFEGWTGSPVFSAGTALTGDVTYTGVRGGKVGDGVDYNITENVLTISGSGKMWDFGTVKSAPWHESSAFQNTDITEIVIGANVTYIGDYAFCNFPNLQSIEIRSNIVEMSTKAFFGCANLKYVYYFGNELEALNCKGLNYQEEVEKLVVYCKEMQIDGVCDTCGETICDHFDSDDDKKCDLCGSDFCAHVDENSDGKCENCKKTLCDHLDRDISYLTEKGILPTIRYWKDVEVTVGGETVVSRITWEYEDGVLTVGGEGALPDVLSGDLTPWASTFAMICKEESLGFAPIYESVIEIIVREGVTAIGDNAFAGLNAVANVVLPKGLKRISATAFAETAFLANEALWNNGFLIVNNCLIKADAEVLNAAENGRVLLDNTLICIAEGAFEGCYAVKEIRLPKTLIGASDLSYLGLDSLEKIFFHGTSVDWANNKLDASCPAAAQVYFFSNRTPTEQGYFWKTLNNPTIYEEWLPV